MASCKMSLEKKAIVFVHEERGELSIMCMVDYVPCTRRWGCMCMPPPFCHYFLMPRQQKQTRKRMAGGSQESTLNTTLNKVSTCCGGCDNPLAHGSHDCPFCHCPRHVWCGCSMEETHGQVGDEVVEGHGVPHVCQPCFDANAQLCHGSRSRRSHSELKNIHLILFSLLF